MVDLDSGHTQLVTLELIFIKKVEVEDDGGGGGDGDVGGTG